MSGAGEHQGLLLRHLQTTVNGQPVQERYVHVCTSKGMVEQIIGVAVRYEERKVVLCKVIESHSAASAFRRTVIRISNPSRWGSKKMRQLSTTHAPAAQGRA